MDMTFSFCSKPKKNTNNKNVKSKYFWVKCNIHLAI